MEQTGSRARVLASKMYFARTRQVGKKHPHSLSEMRDPVEKKYGLFLSVSWPPKVRKETEPSAAALKSLSFIGDFGAHNT